MDLKIGNYIIENDPRVKGMIFMDTPIPMIALFAVYLFIVKYWGPRFMKDREAYKLKTFIAFYNIFQVIACGIAIREFFYAGFKIETILKCEQPNFQTESPRMLRCRNLMLGLKAIELLETVIFVLRKKQNQVSGLHVYHHISTFFLGWYFMKYVGGGMLQFPVIINSIVHIVMYFYYFLASLGPKVQSKLQGFKQFITIFQMVQFGMILLNCAAALMPSCATPRTTFYLCLCCPDVMLLFHMFYSFYKKAYQKKLKVKSS